MGYNHYCYYLNVKQHPKKYLVFWNNVENTYLGTDLFSLVLKSYPKVAAQHMLERFFTQYVDFIQRKTQRNLKGQQHPKTMKQTSLQDVICIQETKPVKGLP